MQRANQAIQFQRRAKAPTRLSWDSLLRQSRLHPKTRNLDHCRTAFEVDYDRVIFSKPFRRLARKTQVHPLATNDHTHNRLTHSLEVASVGRSLGKAAFGIAQEQEAMPIAGNAEDFSQLVQAASLAHDVGNTPFGHAGERAIRAWMREQESVLLQSLSHAQQFDLKLYEGNAQAFRLTTRTVSECNELETRSPGGLALTAATLATMLKYPWHSDHQNAQAEGKYSVFQSDLDAFDWVVSETGLLFSNGAYCRHPLTFLVEAADDICNSVIDIEDAIELHLLLKSDVSDSLSTLSGLDKSTPVSQMRASAIGNMTNACAKVFSERYNEIMLGQYSTALISEIEPHMYSAFKELNTIAQDKVYPFRHNDEMEKTCENTLASILAGATQISPLQEPLASDEVTKPFIDFIETLSCQSLSEYEHLMKIMDFVAGMTDNYAVNVSPRLLAAQALK